MCEVNIEAVAHPICLCIQVNGSEFKFLTTYTYFYIAISIDSLQLHSIYQWTRILHEKGFGTDNENDREKSHSRYVCVRERAIDINQYAR